MEKSNHPIDKSIILPDKLYLCISNTARYRTASVCFIEFEELEKFAKKINVNVNPLLSWLPSVKSITVAKNTDVYGGKRVDLNLEVTNDKLFAESSPQATLLQSLAKAALAGDDVLNFADRAGLSLGMPALFPEHTDLFGSSCLAFRLQSKNGCDRVRMYTIYDNNANLVYIASPAFIEELQNCDTDSKLRKLVNRLPSKSTRYLFPMDDKHSSLFNKLLRYDSAPTHNHNCIETGAYRGDGTPVTMSFFGSRLLNRLRRPRAQRKLTKAAITRKAVMLEAYNRYRTIRRRLLRLYIIRNEINTFLFELLLCIVQSKSGLSTPFINPGYHRSRWSRNVNITITLKDALSTEAKSQCAMDYFWATLLSSIPNQKLLRVVQQIRSNQLMQTRDTYLLIEILFGSKNADKVSEFAEIKNSYIVQKFGPTFSAFRKSISTARHKEIFGLTHEQVEQVKTRTEQFIRKYNRSQQTDSGGSVVSKATV